MWQQSLFDIRLPPEIKDFGDLDWQTFWYDRDPKLTSMEFCEYARQCMDPETKAAFDAELHNIFSGTIGN